MLSISGLLLLVLAAALCPASADYVTWQQCKTRGRRERVRAYPTDDDAEWLVAAMCRITKNVTSGDFDGLHNLTTLFLQYNDITHVDSTAFRAVPKLKKLDLTFNKLSEVPVFDELSCPSLTELYLWNNAITGINNGKTFYGCTKLQYLSLAHNRIDNLHPDLFSPLTELRRLYVNDNKITSIPDQLFARNSKLERLELTDNKISNLPANFVSNLKRAGASLQIFYFHNNPWDCGCLLELLMDLNRVGVEEYSVWNYDGTRALCAYTSNHQCRRAPQILQSPTNFQ